MKRLLTCIILFLYTLAFNTDFINSVYSESTDTYFVVTAYYSPLPDQEYYITGDYEKEKRLNGQGIAGASGKKVYSGMLAAPAKYNFGTKIYLEGLGVGSVEDRGGAIVPAGERGYSYDRIDVWVGYGDEGLRRAMYWGKRTIKGKVLPSSSTESLDYNSISAPNWATKNLKKVTNVNSNTQVVSNSVALVIPKTTKPKTIFETPVTPKSQKEKIAKMQELFDTIGYLEEGYEVGVYDQITVDSIVGFQLKYGIIQDIDEAGSGHFGPKTRKQLKEIYQNFKIFEKSKHSFLNELTQVKNDSVEATNTIIETIDSPEFQDVGTNVRVLQQQLKTLGFFERNDTAIFGAKTKEALIDFQVYAGVISNEESFEAGIYGPKTKKALKEAILKHFLKSYVTSENITKKYSFYVQNKYSYVESQNTPIFTEVIAKEDSFVREI